MSEVLEADPKFPPPRRGGGWVATVAVDDRPNLFQALRLLVQGLKQQAKTEKYEVAVRAVAQTPALQDFSPAQIQVASDFLKFLASKNGFIERVEHINFPELSQNINGAEKRLGLLARCVQGLTQVNCAAADLVTPLSNRAVKSDGCYLQPHTLHNLFPGRVLSALAQFHEHSIGNGEQHEVRALKALMKVAVPAQGNEGPV